MLPHLSEHYLAVSKSLVRVTERGNDLPIRTRTILPESARLLDDHEITELQAIASGFFKRFRLI
ncbi:hypothetical protein C7E18_00080 [Stenotrophomonas maltophilia]|nr:hypothetical protein C7E18_00080 [Stenotrophomonas maltophilia]